MLQEEEANKARRRCRKDQNERWSQKSRRENAERQERSRGIAKAC